MVINWEKAGEFVILAMQLANKNEEIPKTDLYGIINAVDAKNEIQFLEHARWILRSVVAGRLYEEDEDAKKLLEMINELLSPVYDQYGKAC
jgi:hypothetical protein